MLKPKGLELGHAYWWVFSSSGFPTMNQHPPMHQLVILSMGWAVFLHPVPDPALTNIVSHSTFFGC